MSWRKVSIPNWDPEEQKRIAEQAVQEMKEKALRRFYENKLAEEVRMSNLNNSKLVQRWRQTLRNRVNEQLKHDVLAIRYTFENILDKKNAMAVSLVKDLYEDDMLHLNAFQNHIQTIDMLAALQKQRIDELSRMTEDQVNMMQEDFSNECDWVNQTAKDEENHIIDVCIAMELKTQEDEYNDLCSFTGERTEIKQAHSHARQLLRLEVEARVGELWGLLRQDLALYLDGSEQRKGAFAIIRDREIAAALEMQMRYNKIDRLRRQVAALKKKLRLNAKDVEAISGKLRNDVHDLYRKYARCRGMMHKRSEYHAEKLIKLSVESNDALTELKRQIGKAKKILKLAELSRKFETAEEKFMPFYSSTISPEEEKELEELVTAPPSEPMAMAMFEFRSMEGFWKRYNKVLLEKQALDLEYKCLVNHNDDLRLVLKSYLNNISVDPEVMSLPNSLLITTSARHNKSTLYADPDADSASYHNVIEGTLVPRMNLR